MSGGRACGPKSQISTCKTVCCTYLLRIFYPPQLLLLFSSPRTIEVARGGNGACRHDWMVFSTKSCSPKPRTTLKACLDQHDLGEVVLTNFWDAGIYDVELATRLDDEQLQTLGVEKMGTRLKLRDTLSAASTAKNVNCFNVFEPLGSMNNDTVISLLTNMGVVSALLASLLFGIVMTIPHEETMLGDKRFLSISSLAFRCQFADWSDPGMTLEICSPELTVLNVQKAISPMDVSCNDGKDWLDQRCQMELCDRSEFLESNNEFDAEDKARMQASFRSVGDVLRVLNGNKLGHAVVRLAGRPSSHGCTARAFQLAEHIASAVSDADYMDFVYSSQADEHGRITGTDSKGWNLGITSTKIALYGFSACSKLMAVVFLSLFGIISLSATDAAVNEAEMNLWWLLGGCAVVLAAMYLTIHGCVDFMIAVEFVIVLRFPLWTQHALWKDDIMDPFVTTWLKVLPALLAIHYVVTRVLSVVLVRHANKARKSAHVNQAREQATIEMGQPFGLRGGPGRHGSATADQSAV